ncbi:MAG: tetratricopeptide repeat protein, partial [Phycisphaerales bacterium]|nr:tetratricopeptide repeat protein [Phycisphaerales bacterium]
AYRLPTTDGTFIDNTDSKDKVVVLVYLSAEQKSSELAAADSSEVFKKFKDTPVRMVHVTADVVHKPYFDRLRAEQGVEVPLGLDASRKLYGELGLIVFPTTIISDRAGKLAHVISTRGPEYPRVLEAYIRHTLGDIDETELTDRLRARSSEMGSPKSLASRHRSAARLLREKGLIEDARRELVKAMELDPADANIRLDLADIDLSSGANTEALELSLAVLAESPEHRRAKQLAGIAKFRLGEVDEARSMLTEALVLNPEPARVLYYLGRIDEMQGQTREALQRYREAAEHLLDE